MRSTIMMITLMVGFNFAMAEWLPQDDGKGSKPAREHAQEKNIEQEMTKPPYCWKPLHDAVVKHNKSIGGKNLTWSDSGIFVPNKKNKNLYRKYCSADVKGVYMSINVELKVKKTNKKCRVLSVKELERHPHP